MKGKKTGGRVKGTPNKDKPLKQFLREHSTDYFTPCIPADEVEIIIKSDVLREKYLGKLISQYEIDLLNMKPADRVGAELQLLKYHTPQMQATAVDLTVAEENQTLTQRLIELSQ